MRNLANNLKNNLSEQLGHYEKMEKLTDHKRELIVKGDVESLSELDKQIETVACHVLELEQKRVTLLERFATKDSRFSDFLMVLEPELAKPLNELREKLMAVMANIKKMNEVNVYLINNSIKWIEHSVNTISNILSPECSAYNARGRALTTSCYGDYASSKIVEHEA
jgi:flagellar biosynthesis/type III secretory pathway chaperone